MLAGTFLLFEGDGAGGGGEDVEAELAASLDPLVVLFGQDRAD
jgi:hypothetical protein